MSHLTLYYSEHCPYCRRVRDFMTQTGITLPMKEIKQNPGYADELMKIGGKTQVPCLSIDGKAMYESLDIIEFLKKNYKK